MSASVIGSAADTTLIPGQYIVVYKDRWGGKISNPVARQVRAFVNARLNELGVVDSVVKHLYEYALRGFAAQLTDSQLRALQNDPRVKYIEQDRRFKVFAAANSSSRAVTTLSSGQSTPWGVTRLKGPFSGTGQTAWIIDSGIDLDHPDLNVDVENSASFIAEENADDIIGHGTHVAGILAAEDNNRDVVGVAAGAEVVSVKVINQNNFGAVSDVVAGVNYVSNLASPNDIINMSIGGPASQAIDDEVITAANTGLRFTIAAGNDKGNANNFSPARVEHPNVWTVSAFRQGDDFAVDFDCNPFFGSNFSGPTNPPIEFSGPGNNIPSLSIGGGTEIRCGTSMAAPHVAGLLLTSPNGLTDDGFVSSDPDGDPDPIAVADIYLSVSISGPSSLAVGETGTWTASVSDGDGNYSYEWYYKSDDTNNQWVGPVGYSSSYSTQMYSFDGPVLDIRVAVNDGSQRNGSSRKSISCTDCELGGGGGPLSTEN